MIDPTVPDRVPNLVQRYQCCALRIWHLFPSDPLPADDPAHFWIERLEAILDRDLLAVKGQLVEPTQQDGDEDE